MFCLERSTTKCGQNSFWSQGGFHVQEAYLCSVVLMISSVIVVVYEGLYWCQRDAISDGRETAFSTG